MNAIQAKRQGFLPVYASHVWEVLAVIKCLTGLQEKRRLQKKHTKLDRWLEDFVQKLEGIAAVMISTQEAGIVYLRKEDRDLIRQLVQWIKINGII